MVRNPLLLSRSSHVVHRLAADARDRDSCRAGIRPPTHRRAIFRGPLAQVGLGVVAGAGLAAALAFGVLRGGLWPRGAALVVAYAALMMGVCMLACIVPTSRALRVEPTEALRADG